MRCKKCNKEISSDSRCCLFCGAINKEEEKNKKIIQEFMLNEQKNKKDKMISKPMIILNIIVIILLISISLLISNIYISCLFFIVYFYALCFQFIFKKASIPWYGIFIPIYNIFLICELSFGTEEGNEKFLILLSIFFYTWDFGPLYEILSDVNLSETLILTIIYTLAFLISTFYTIVLYKLLSALAKNFNQNNVLVFTFPAIMLPIIAFNKKISYHNNTF